MHQNPKLSASPLSIADITTAVAGVQRARRGRPILSAEEKTRRKDEATSNAFARFSRAPDDAYNRLPVITALFGISPATWWRWVKQHPELLKPTKLSERVTAWSCGQIRAFMQSRMAAA